MIQFTDEQRMIKATIRQLATEKIAPLAKDADASGHTSSEIVRLLATIDLLNMALPQEYGGIDADYTTTAAAVEEMAKVDASTAMITFVNQAFIHILKQWGNEEQKERFFGQMATGDKINAFSLTEPDHGSEAAEIQTSAELDGDHYIVNGTKIFVTSGTVADHVLVFVRIGTEKGYKGVSALIIEKDTPGFTVGKREEKLGMRGSDLAELTFKDARVPKQNLVGGPGKGWDILMTAAADMRAYGPGAISVGLSRGAMKMAAEYAQQRIQFGKPISKLQSIRFMLADMSMQIDAARALLYRTTSYMDSTAPGRDRLRSRLGSSVKCFASDVAMRVTTDAVQILGGYGVMKDYPLERMMRDAKMIQIFDGSNQIQRVIVAKCLL